MDIKFRCIRCVHCEGHSKYMYASGGTEHRLYNVGAFFAHSDRIVLTEGELDTIAVQAWTGLPAVAYPGVSAWKPYFGRCFAGYEQVLVVADGDEAGREAAKTVAREVGVHADGAAVVRLPDGYDSNTYLAEFGVGPYLEVLGIER